MKQSVLQFVDDDDGDDDDDDGDDADDDGDDDDDNGDDGDDVVVDDDDEQYRVESVWLVLVAEANLAPPRLFNKKK